MTCPQHAVFSPKYGGDRLIWHGVSLAAMLGEDAANSTLAFTVNAVTPSSTDKDGDGFPAPGDWDDDNGAIYPGGAETKHDGIDVMACVG